VPTHLSSALSLSAGSSAHNCLGSAAMHAAAVNGHVEVIRLLLEAEDRIESAPQPLERAKSAVSVFSAASTMSKIANVAEGKLLEALDSCGRSPLHLAAETAAGAAAVPLLLSSAEEQGLPLLGVDDRGLSPVHAAAEAGAHDALDAMLGALTAAAVPSAAGSGAAHLDYRGETALLKACRAGHVRCVKSLIETYASGPDGDALVNRISDGPEGTTALLEAVRFNHVDVCELLANHPLGRLDVTDAKGWNAVHTAAYHGGVDVLAVLLAHCADVDIGGKGPDYDGVTALHRACCHDHPDALAALVARGADPHRRDVKGRSALHHAAAFGVTPNGCVDALIAEHGVKVSAVDTDGATALHTAAALGHVEFCRFLLKQHKADPMATDSNGRSVLHIACAKGALEVVHDVRAMADDFGHLVNAPDADGSTPLFMAITAGALDIASLLIDAGAETRAKNDSGATPLHRAISLHVERPGQGVDYLMAVGFLLRKGAEANEPDNAGQTPFDIALASKDPAAVHCFQGGYAT